MNFLYFKKEDGSTTTEAKVLGYQIFGEEMDDIDFKLTIKNNKIQIESYNNIDCFGKNCDNEINEDIANSPVNWENGYEFIDYIDLIDESPLLLVSDESSLTFKLVSSQRNINNINNIKKTLKNK